EIGGRIIRRSYETVTVAGDQLPVAIMDCASLLVEYTLPAIESCVEGEVYRIDLGSGPDVPPGVEVRGERWSFPAPPQLLHPQALGSQSSALGALLVTPSAPALSGAPPRTSWADVVVPDRDAAEALAQVV